MRVLPKPLFCFLAMTGFTSREALASMRVRVTAPSHIEARVDHSSAAMGRAVVRGTLRDDVGNPVVMSHVAIEFYEGDGSGPPISLPLPLRCSGDSSPDAHVAPDEYVVDTDRAGAFCFESALGIDRGVMKLAFAGDQDHDAAAANVPIDLARPTASLAFDPEPNILSLDRPTISTSVRVTAPGLNKDGWRITVRDERHTLLGSAPVDPDGTARVPLQAQEMGAPGPGELDASLEGAPVFAPPIRIPIERHARVDVDVLSPRAEGAPDEGIPFLVRAHWARGPVPIGSIEARLGELSVGIGSLRNGEARVTAIFAAGRALDLTVRAVYVPAAPWWEPGAPGVITVTVRPGTPWRRIAFSVLALALVAWVIREAYDFRPFRRSRVATEKPKLAEPVGRAEVVRPRAPREGWAGVVFDAHEGAPIRGAAIAVVLAGFPGADGSTGTRVLAERIADDAGQFALAEPAFPRGALLRISAPTHGPIEIPLPPPSDLSIAMVSRKRNLLERVVKFALREWGAWDDSRRDPTPDQVARRARREADPIASDGRAKQIEAYARATESAAFGPGTVDASTETEVLGLEPR